MKVAGRKKPNGVEYRRQSPLAGSRQLKFMEKIEIIIPKGATNKIELGLVELTEYLSKKLKIETGYGLGGEFGYGVDFENNIFMMHQFCWCEKDDCPWCGEEDRPNFIFKPTNAKVWWYKWIGRSQKQKGRLPKDWLKKCKNSVN